MDEVSGVRHQASGGVEFLACRHGVFRGLCGDTRCLLEVGDLAQGEEYVGLMNSVAERPYPLPRMVAVEWRRTTRAERVQHAVGFLVAENETHLVLCDKFDGKHPDSRRLWTIDRSDVVVTEVL